MGWPYTIIAIGWCMSLICITWLETTGKNPDRLITFIIAAAPVVLGHVVPGIARRGKLDPPDPPPGTTPPVEKEENNDQ
jgi:hypothetical protein